MLRLLEIGPGIFPAVSEPGAYFLENDVEYVGAEPDPEDATVARKKLALSGYVGEICVEEGALLAAQPTESFDRVIMKSLFGEYTGNRSDTATSLDNTRAVLYEAFRLLRPSGQVIIAEENTPQAPATPHQISDVLLHAGFNDITVFPSQKFENPHWERIRSTYWSMSHLPIDKRWSYAITALRTAADLEKFTLILSDRHKWEDNRRTGNNQRDWTKTVEMVKAPQAQRSGDFYERMATVKVVTKDEETDLATLHKTGRKHRFFL